LSFVVLTAQAPFLLLVGAALLTSLLVYWSKHVWYPSPQQALVGANQHAYLLYVVVYATLAKGVCSFQHTPLFPSYSTL